MMKLINKNIEVNFKNKGGQLSSLKSLDNGIEYIWTGDEKFWSYHTPPLFPIVGKVIDNRYTLDGKVYHLNQHGIARLFDHEVVEKTTSSITFQFIANEETLKVYPFLFSFKTKYTLLDKGIDITYIVHNTDNKTIYFQIGAHPAFNVPFTKNSHFQDYYLAFESNEIAYSKVLSANGTITRDTKQIMSNEKYIGVSKSLFENDALIFENLTSSYVYLKSPKESSYIKFSFKEFPYIAFWSKIDDAPFLCIEPWFSHSDYDGFNDDFKNKEGIIKLNQNKEFKCSYQIEILKEDK